jgi:acetyl esterase/lipase
MSLAYNPLIADAMAAMAEATASHPTPAVGDWKTRRDGMDVMFAQIGAGMPMPEGVEITDHEVSGPDGPVPVRLYRPAGALPAVALYVHGGGMIGGTLAGYDPLVAGYAAASHVTLLSVDYRLAPEHPFPAGVDDAFAALTWLAEHSTDWGADPGHVGIMGDSAGGGIAAGVALMARDRGGPALAGQVLVYPMLDDRTITPDPALEGLTTWSYDDNVTGWRALLGDDAQGVDVSPYAAPARAADLSGLPPTYIDVGGLDIFRDEDIAYAARLSAAGVPTELHVVPGAPHGYEILGGLCDLTTRAMTDRSRALADLAR